MKRSFNSVRGVTLLEIMLVLAIAAMVIVMSIRYYQNASNSQNSNIILQQIQSITAAADSLAQGSGTYAAASQASVLAVVGANNMKTPYGTTITISGGAPTTYSVTVSGIPTAVCTTIKAQLAANNKIGQATPAPACAGTPANLTYSYDSTK